jgi:hypothetical protein
VFLKAHWRSVVAADFFTAEVWTIKGLITHYVLFVIELAKRIVHILGITTHPDEAWMLQVGRNATDTLDGALTGKSQLIIDRDIKYSRLLDAPFRCSICHNYLAGIPRSRTQFKPLTMVHRIVLLTLALSCTKK